MSTPDSAAPPAGPRRARSLRAQLLRPLAWIWSLGLAVAAFGAYELAVVAGDAAFDRGLQDSATALAGKVVWTDRGPLLDVSRQYFELLTWDQTELSNYAMLDEQGQVLAGDAAVPAPRQRVSRRAFERPMLYNARMGEEAVRGALFSIASPMLDRHVSIIVVETLHKRQRLVLDVLTVMAVPTLGLGLLTLSLLAWGIRRGVAPLRAVAAEVASREPSDWRPLAVQGVPAEVLPLIERINSLLANVEESVALQRRFVADAAHQLRTPVAGLRVLSQELAAELGSQGGAPAGRTGPLLEGLQQSSERMGKLIAQLLTLARAEAALMQLQGVEPMALGPLIHEAVEPLALEAVRRGSEIQLQLDEPPERPLEARAHALWLSEAISNALDNALRYGGRHIRVHLQAEDGWACIRISDDGPGVAAADLPRLGQAFWRGERADVQTQDGTGLGLAIAHDIIRRLGGRWEVRSRPEFPGLELVWRLPLV